MIGETPGVFTKSKLFREEEFLGQDSYYEVFL